jgi:hypothetical protein
MDEGYVASLFDANLRASGDAQKEAVSNLKDMMLILYRSLRASCDRPLPRHPADPVAGIDHWCPL